MLRGQYIYLLLLPIGHGTSDLSKDTEVFLVSSQFQNLQTISLADEYFLFLTCYVDIVHIIATTKGQRKTPVLFFYGKLRELTWNLGHILWADHSGLPDYSMAKGRAILKS